MRFTKLKSVALLCAAFAGIAGMAGAETLKIGVISPLTGGGAPWGVAAAQGVHIRAAEINAEGGLDVGGEKLEIEVISYDDQFKAADAVAAYNRLVNQDGVQYILVLTSPSTLALKDRVEDDEVITFSAAGLAEAVDPSSTYMYRMISLLRDYVPPMISWVKDNVEGHRVVVINPNDDSGLSSTRLAVENYTANGFEIVSTELFERTQKDFQPMLTKVLALNPDIIELASTPPATTGLIVRQARDLGYEGTFIKDSGAATREVLESAGNEGAEGMISLHFADRTNEGYKRIASEYRKTIGQEPDDLIVIFYDALNVVLAAIQKAGEIDDTAKVVEAMPSIMPIRSVQGDDLTFGGNGAPGDPNQIMTYSFISVMKDGIPDIVAKVR